RMGQARRGGDDDDARSIRQIHERRRCQVGAHREDFGRAAGQVGRGARSHIAMNEQETEAGRPLRLLSAGAAKGIVLALTPTWRDETGGEVVATFGAVGAIKEALDAGAGCDVIVLTQKMIGALADEARLQADTVAPLGAVRTGIAVRAGDRLPDVGDAAALRAALVAANTIYFPDPERATAGVHFMKVLQ